LVVVIGERAAGGAQGSDPGIHIGIGSGANVKGTLANGNELKAVLLTAIIGRSNSSTN
jgi:hypothetical protein